MNRLSCQPRPDSETEILIGAGARRELPAEIAKRGERSIVALLDPAAGGASDLLDPAWRVIELPGGEGCKTFATLERVLRQMARWRLDRRTLLVAIGGGTIGDLGGLCATLYMRGVELIQVPTTLLAMLDSSVGGKTAINIEEGKNLIGSFWPPTLMLADLEFARSLPRDHLLSGLAEAIKMGVGFDAALFELLESAREEILAGDPELLTQVVTMAVQNKIDTVEADPFESTGRRQCLNLGHTLAHALEAISDFQTLHGHAVAQGLHFALDLATDRGLMETAAADRCRRLLVDYGFARETWPGAPELLPYFERDKKVANGLLHFVVPTAIGACRTAAMPPASILGG